MFRSIISITLISSTLISQTTTSLISEQEKKHFKSIQQLTFGGDNAEAYFDKTGTKLTFQVTNKNWNVSCDQIYYLYLKKIKNKDLSKESSFKKISTGKGRTTCSYFMPDGKHILFASTHHKMDSCPPVPHIKGKYVWPLYPEYDIFVADLNGKIVKQLTDNNYYDAEATVSPKGDKIVFTSTRSGDIELWVMNIDGSNPVQITNELGYDGGAFFSPDGSKIVFRASRPKTEEEIKEYKELLAQNLVAPTNMEIFVCDADGKNLQQVTHLGKANWAPFFHPSGKKIIFSSNHHSQRGYDFQLYMIDIDGKNLEQITTESNFNAFPMFSPDGKKLIFSSNRNNNNTRDTNLFLVEWKD
jgi:Tol biopolymer transport system component